VSDSQTVVSGPISSRLVAVTAGTSQFQVTGPVPVSQVFVHQWNQHFISGSTFLSNYDQTSLFVTVSQKVTRSLWRNHKFNDLYVEYATGRISKTEFKALSKQYAVELRTLTPEEATEEIKIVSFLLGNTEELDSSDLSIMLDAHTDAFESAIPKLNRLTLKDA
jgi:hypothetical protein